MINSLQLLPHGYCISWQPGLIAAMVIGNLLISLAYFAIPLIILKFIQQRQDIDFRYLHWLFAGFIVTCGFTHLLHIVELWYPIYYLEAVADMTTAFVSIITAIVLWRLLPVFISLPSVNQLQAANDELKKVSTQLQDKEAQLRSLGDSLPDSFLYRYTLEGDKPKFLYVSSGVERLNGVKAELAMQDTMLLMGQIDPKQREAYIEAQSASQRDLSDFSMDLHMLREDGTWRWVQVKSHPHRKENGQVIWDGIATDITNRHLLETEINRLAQAVEQNPTGILITNIKGMPEFMNEACSRINGYQFADAYSKNMTPREIIFNDMTEAQYESVQTQLRSGKIWSGLLHNRHKNGIMYWEQVTASPIYDNDGNVASFLFLRSDVTEQKNAETTRTQLAAIVESSNDAIIGKTTDGIIISWNKGAEKIYGYTADEIIGKSITILSPPWLQSEMLEFLKTVCKGKFVVNHETERIRKDGVRIHVALTISPIIDASGKVTGISTIARDITERKQAEKEILHLNQELEARVADRTAQLEAANKELEAFSYSVSHDLRTPLRHIDGFVSMLIENNKNQLDNNSLHYLDVISKSASTMNKLIEDLLSFSRMGRNEMVKSLIDLNALCHETIRDLEPETKDRVIHWKIENLPMVSGDLAMLRLVWVNLISNALKFTRLREKAEIEIGYIPDSKTETVIFIRDNGVGFDMKYVDKLFGVFQRLHSLENFEGTGIGLANIHRIISRHGGRTWAEGKVDEGATFYFSLPTT